VAELSVIAEGFAESIVAAVQQEYPNALRHVMQHDGDRPTPRQAHPAFYGCFDWHSAVEMHWALAVLLRHDPSAEWAPAAREVLDRHLSPANVQTEADYLAANPGFERPYGWGWALELATERDVAPLAEVVEAAFIAWLPKPAYPDRTGMHSNSAFALARALPYARTRSDGALLDAITAAALRWFGDDTDYPSRFEPGGADFLSPTLTELVLMQSLLTPVAFDQWWTKFNGRTVPAHLVEPALVTDAQDGQGAHLLGLNLYRVHALRQLGVEPSPILLAAADEALTAEGWMAEHWLAAYGVLAFGAP
jgi:hypothetical protein